MSQKASLTQSAHCVRQALTAYNLLPDFYSGCATGMSGRFAEGLLLRRLQVNARRITISRSLTPRRQCAKRRRFSQFSPSAAAINNSASDYRTSPDDDNSDHASNKGSIDDGSNTLER
jgi:hypothetical protein